MTISNLISNTCYLFGIQGYTINGHGAQTVIPNQTLVGPSSTVKPSMMDPSLYTDSSKR